MQEMTGMLFGFVEHVRPTVTTMSVTPMQWTMPPVPLGTHGSRWW